MPSNKLTALEIRALAHDGSGIGFIDASAASRGKAIFVKGALPGQIVSCEILRDKGRLADARLLAVLDSPFQPQDSCPHWHECGGCPLQPLPYGVQLFWKERLARDAIERIGRFAKDELDISWACGKEDCVMPRERNKVVLAFGSDAEGRLAIGFRRRSSHQVFQLQNCALLPASALRIVESCRQIILESGIAQESLRFLTLRKSAGELWTAILLTGPGNVRERGKISKLAARLLASEPALEQFLHEERRKRDLLAYGEKRLLIARRDRKSDAVMRMQLRGRDFCIDPGSFFQVNPAGADCLARTVIASDIMSGPLLDLYCGSGSPGQLLAERHDSCLGIEQDPRAIKFACQNAADLPGYEYMSGDVETLLEKKEISKRKFPVALLDPPRAGVAAQALDQLIAMAPERIIYVSCNPATLARDGSLLQAGYQLSHIQLIDMFPDTPHMECCAIWARKS